MRTSIRALGTITLIAAGLYAQNAAALSVTPISQGQLPSGDTIVIVLITLDPGDTVPWHFHTGPGWGTIVSGTLTEDEGCGNPQSQFPAGTAFAEIPGRVHRVFNLGQVPLVFSWAEVYPSCDPNAGTVLVTEPTCEGLSGRAHLEKIPTCP